ncbi:hypothetical protein GCM10010129_41410 [Streptomyces fumigatiscleroticus]|nr:hypothetical protein GCM10010129_41410 [Streptomyces fumigatiscleroticus]
MTADAVVVATGMSPRELPGRGGRLRGVHVVRTVGDAVALRSALLNARRVVVAGDGVLGAETAATVRRMGLDVWVAGPQPAPLTDQLGPFAAGHLAALHTANGVRLRTGVLLDALLSRDGAVTGVRLSDGEELPADVVVAAVGCSPETDWLLGSGLELDDGVVCDARCRAAEGVRAVGAGGGEPAAVPAPGAGLDVVAADPDDVGRVGGGPAPEDGPEDLAAVAVGGGGHALEVPRAEARGDVRRQADDLLGDTGRVQAHQLVAGAGAASTASQKPPCGRAWTPSAA